MKQGDLVKVVAFGGEELTRRVVAEGNGVIYVCSEQEYHAALTQGREPLCVGFQQDDVTPITEQSPPRETA